MKRNVLFLLVVACVIVSLPAASQKYRSAADTVKLNRELVKVNNDIAKLTAELTVAQNNLPGYVSKAKTATNEAEATAQQSSDQAYKATNGDVQDAKSAKKKARKAYKDAGDASDARANTKKQEKKIDKLSAKLQKKQNDLKGLEEIRTNLRLMNQ
jgi:DNA repair exonuclease SbcCD ATPase subunit